ncbi:MAG: hypothetical protein AABZ57_04295, partial [Candidatus Margulisiibacteriota bacterium]
MSQINEMDAAVGFVNEKLNSCYQDDLIFFFKLSWKEDKDFEKNDNTRKRLGISPDQLFNLSLDQIITLAETYLKTHIEEREDILSRSRTLYFAVKQARYSAAQRVLSQFRTEDYDGYNRIVGEKEESVLKEYAKQKLHKKAKSNSVLAGLSSGQIQALDEQLIKASREAQKLVSNRLQNNDPEKEGAEARFKSEAGSDIAKNSALLHASGINPDELSAKLDKMWAVRVIDKQADNLIRTGRLEQALELLKREDVKKKYETAGFDVCAMIDNLEEQRKISLNGSGAITFKYKGDNLWVSIDNRPEDIKLYDNQGKLVDNWISLKEIAVLLHSAIGKSGSVYLSIDPANAVKKENRKVFVTAILTFYSDHREQIDLENAKILEAGYKKENIDRKLTLHKRVDPKPNPGFIAMGEIQEAENKDRTVYLSKSFTTVLNTAKTNSGTVAAIRAQSVKGKKDIFKYSDVQKLTDPAEFARKYPLAALMIKLNTWAIASGFNTKGMPEYISDEMSIDDLKMLSQYLSAGSKYAGAYFHRPLNGSERETLLAMRKKLKEGTSEYRVLTKLISIPFDPSNLDSKKIRLENDKEFDVLDGLLTDPKISKATKDLISEIRGSYFADTESAPEEAKKVDTLIKWMGTDGNPRILTPKVLQERIHFDYNSPVGGPEEEGMKTVAREALGARIGFDPRKSQKREKNIAYRLIRDPAISAWRLFSEGGKSVPVAMGINSVENWRLIVLKRMYLTEKGKQPDFETLQTQLTKQHELIEKIKTDLRKNGTALSQEQKEKKLKPLIEQFEYLKGKLDCAYQQLFIIDKGFFEWFSSKFVVSSRFDKIISSFTDAELQSKMIDPFTGESIRLKDLFGRLKQAQNDPAVKEDLRIGWLSLDPTRGNFNTHLVKMALALYISYLPLKKDVFEPADAPIEHLKMGMGFMLKNEGPVSHIGAGLKSELLFIFRDDTLKRVTIMRKMSNPDAFGSEMILLLKKAIELVRPDIKKDKRILDWLDEAAKSLKGKTVIVDSKNLDDENVQKIMKAYHYLGKLSSGDMNKKTHQNSNGAGVKTKNPGPGFWATVSGGLLSGNGGYGPAEEHGAMETTLSDWLNVHNPIAQAALAVFDIPIEMGSTLLRFGPYAGSMLGVVLPFRLGHSIYNIFKGKTTIATDVSGVPFEDENGRLVFLNRNYKKGESWEEVAKSIVDLGAMFFLFRNDPFLLYGWLGVP